MEITFARTIRYSVDVSSPADYMSLAKALDISVGKLKKLITAGELLDDSDLADGVTRWLDEQPVTFNIVDEENIEDLEVWSE